MSLAETVRLTDVNAITGRKRPLRRMQMNGTCRPELTFMILTHIGRSRRPDTVVRSNVSEHSQRYVPFG